MKDGKYTAKSGYLIAKAFQRREKGDEGTSSGSEVEDERKMWRTVWSLNIKNKIQHFP